MNSTFDRISLEPSRVCSKRCSFCYNGSTPAGVTGFSGAEVVELGRDCARHGVAFLSIGGGEPLEWPGLFEALDGLRGVVSRTFTTNGLQFIDRPSLLDDVARAAPDKVHVSIHFPANGAEVRRVAAQVLELDDRGVATGVNFVVRRSEIAVARSAVEQLVAAGLEAHRMVFLPSRGIEGETPTPAEVAFVATGQSTPGLPFQSMSCLTGCRSSARFVSIAADRTVALCSYTTSRRKLRALTFAAVAEALSAPAALGLTPCSVALVRSLETS